MKIDTKYCLENVKYLIIDETTGEIFGFDNLRLATAVFKKCLSWGHISFTVNSYSLARIYNNLVTGF